jgi:hypothetical protein
VYLRLDCKLYSGIRNPFDCELNANKATTKAGQRQNYG